nr:reverse transcriptase domain-containing protein [Tanacetum cinerariifolium]
MPIELGNFDAIIGMDWLRRHHAMIVCDEKLVRVPFGNETLIFRGAESYIRRESRLMVISCSKVREYRAKGCHVFLAQISGAQEDDKPERKQVKNVPILQDFPEVFLENLPGTSWSKMPITDVLGRGWRISTDWPRVNLRNDGKDSPDQAEDASCSRSTKELL